MTVNAKSSAMIVGEAASPGLARGAAFVCTCGDLGIAPRRAISKDDTQKELQKFDAAISEAENELLNLQKKVRETIGEKEASIFGAHIQLLHDPLLREEVSVLCLTQLINVETALEQAIDKLALLFVQMEDPFFRDRAADLRDVGKRLHDILVKSELPKIPLLPDGSVLVARELLPSIVAQLSSRAIRGLIIEEGGQTAHATILARAGGVPLLIHTASATEKIRTGDSLIADGFSGRVFINPAPSIQREYDRLEADLQAHNAVLKSLIALPAETRDGTLIKLCANIGKSADAVAAKALNADGVGLYRTEFVFLVQDHFPSEEEQYQIYRNTADRIKPGEMVIRVLDLGSDKRLPYFPLPFEANPSLGCRGIRLLIKHPQILLTQLRAILRLSATHSVSILIPMVGGVEDLHAAKAAIKAAKKSLASEGLPFNPHIPVGAMIETPAAAIMAGQLAEEIDYFSIGTNDLVQYLLTADRTSSGVAVYYEPLHPAMLQVLASIASAAKEKSKSISICGEIAGNPLYTELLLGLGYRNFSVNPGEILEIKNAIRSTTIEDAEKLAGQVLRLGTIQQIKDCIHKISPCGTKELSKGVRGPSYQPLQNEQGDPVFCSNCGKLSKSSKGEEGCICESETGYGTASKTPAE